MAGHANVIQTLVESSADTTATNQDGKTALCIAANSIKGDVITYLITKPHDVFLLMTDPTFMFDLMMCSKTLHNKPLQEFITTSPSPVEIALRLAKFYKDLCGKEKERERDLVMAAKFCEQLGNDLLVTACNKFEPSVLLRALDNDDKSLMEVLLWVIYYLFEHKVPAVSDTISHPSCAM